MNHNSRVDHLFESSAAIGFGLGEAQEGLHLQAPMVLGSLQVRSALPVSAINTIILFPF